MGKRKTQRADISRKPRLKMADKSASGVSSEKAVDSKSKKPSMPVARSIAETVRLGEQFLGGASLSYLRKTSRQGATTQKAKKPTKAKRLGTMTTTVNCAVEFLGRNEPKGKRGKKTDPAPAAEEEKKE